MCRGISSFCTLVVRSIRIVDFSKSVLSSRFVHQYSIGASVAKHSVASVLKVEIGLEFEFQQYKLTSSRDLNSIPRCPTK